MTLQETVSLLNLAAVVVTGIVVTWYTWETRQLRHATLRQSALQIRPFLAIGYDDDRLIRVHNLGKGVARDVRFHDVTLGTPVAADAEFYVVKWRPIDFIPPQAKREMDGVYVLVTPTERTEEVTSQPRHVWMSNFGPHGREQYEFVADYADLTGTKYRAAFKVHKGHTELLRDDEYVAR